jgi:glycine/sarcosine N-methyltransferase
MTAVASDPEDHSALAFYEGFAAEYHLMWDDWGAAAVRHGRVLGAVLAAHGVGPPASVLDCSCGIGTQALGLAHGGYTVTGTDLSPTAVERAREESGRRGIPVTLAVADMRAVDRVVGRTYDAVVSADNSLPHLLTDDDLAAAVGSIRRCVKPGGVFLATIRDYDQLAELRPPGMMPCIIDGPEGRRIIGQAWEWAPDSESVRINLFILREGDEHWTCSMHTTRYRALRRPVLTDALTAAGFAAVSWHPPDTTGFYQPIVTAVAD